MVIDSEPRACHFDFYRKDGIMLLTLLRALKELLLSPPPTPCCASAIYWASFR